MSHNEIFEKLKLTAVECSSDVKLPDLEFVSEILRSDLETLGMSPPKSKITEDSKNRSRVPDQDPPYSLEKPAGVPGRYPRTLLSQFQRVGSYTLCR
jgi:hypothetical protein